MLISASENIYAIDIENYLSDQQGVADALALIEQDQYWVLVINEKGKEPDLNEISVDLATIFGIGPKAVLPGTQKDIVRTTSGKPQRMLTLEGLLNRSAVL